MALPSYLTGNDQFKEISLLTQWKFQGGGGFQSHRPKGKYSMIPNWWDGRRVQTRKSQKPTEQNCLHIISMPGLKKCWKSSLYNMISNRIFFFNNITYI